ncbi:MAG TPA: T9SS type A sorting domain-containing protein, partial [Calditrichia bacterium]|nr:T9SS type A sorting domain-containing protein [Calditrichia bacterium]
TIALFRQTVLTFILTAGVVYAQPNLQIADTDMIFDRMSSGNYQEISNTFTNIGDQDLEVYNFQVLGASQVFGVVNGITFTLSPNESREVVIRAQSFTEGQFSGEIHVITNEPDLQTIFNARVVVANTTISFTQTNAVTIGQPVDFQISSGSFQAEGGQLLYRKVGEIDYTPVDLIPGEVYSGRIPGEDVTVRGLEYYIYFYQTELVETYPVLHPAENPLQYEVRLVDYTPPVQRLANRYAMFSLPVSLIEYEVEDLMGDDYGPYQPDRWRLLTWGDTYGERGEDKTHQTQGYSEYGGDQYFYLNPGKGYWLIEAVGQMFDIGAAYSIRGGYTGYISLEPGWNQVGNPYPFPVAWADIDSSELVSRPVSWDPAQQRYVYNNSLLQPWEGYFVYNPTATYQYLYVHPVEYSAGFGKGEIVEKLPAPGEFDLLLTLTSPKAGWVDGDNVVGMRRDAAEGLDLTDNPAAPPIIETNNLVIVDPAADLAESYVPQNADGGSWELQIRGAARGETGILEIEGMENLPPGFSVWLLDLQGRNSVALNHGEARVTIPAAGGIADYQLIVGTPDFAEGQRQEIPLQPMDYRLAQNYPNPFNPETTISFQMARKGTANLTVYNALGQVVTTLVDGVLNTGPQQVLWDGRDRFGKGVASGVYFYQLRTDSFSETRKMMLIR